MAEEDGSNHGQNLCRGAWGWRAGHLAVEAGRDILGRAALPDDLLGGVVQLAEEDVGDAGVPPPQLEQVPGVERGKRGTVQVFIIIIAIITIIHII